MGRKTTGSTYVQPYKADGTLETEDGTELGRGTYTLASGTTYYFPLGGADTPVSSVHLQHDAAVIITTATIEDTNFPGRGPDGDVTDYSATAGHWIDENPSTAFVGTVGAGTSATNGVVAVTGGNAGGAMWHVADTGARRTRLAVVVGGTGGEVRVAVWGKE